MRVLTDREREVLRLRFAEDLTQAEIGARIGVSQMHVSRIIRQAIVRLREAAERGVVSAPWSTGTCAPSTIEPHQPKILHSARGEARSILINLPAGEELQEHQVHERAYVVVIDGEVELGGHARRRRAAAAVFDPNERHAAKAISDARLLIVLAPWPGDGHPGAR